MWMRGPNIAAGQSISTPVLTIDIAPTVLDLAGVAQNYDDMDGLSINPLIINTTNADLEKATPANLTATEGRTTMTNSTTLNSSVPISYNYTGIQGRHSFLIEYSGEGSAGTSSSSCAGQLNHDLPNLSQCSDMFGCKCQDARNNTYTCLRTIGQEDTIFCQFEDSVNFIEVYSILQDPYQTQNLASLLSKDTIELYKVLLFTLIKSY